MLVNLLSLQTITLNSSLSTQKFLCEGNRLGILPVLAMVVLVYGCMSKHPSQVGRQLAAFWPVATRTVCLLAA